jgi:TRAP-type C4-dicarboxylate transport system substrate-binding protein
MIDEGISLPVTEDQVRAQRVLGDTPLVVITHGKKMFFGRLSEDEQQLLEDAWQEAQHESTRLSTQGRLVVAEKSGHIIQFEQPEVIVEAVEEMVKVVRTSGA